MTERLRCRGCSYELGEMHTVGCSVAGDCDVVRDEHCRPGPTHLHVQINAETDKALRTYARDHGVTITEAVRRSVALMELVESETDAGSDIHITRLDGAVIRLLPLGKADLRG